MAKRGRPVTNNSPAAKARRERQRKWYQGKSTEERRGIVQRRSKQAQHLADERRDAKANPERQQAHNELVKKEARQHPEKVAAREKAPSCKGKKCHIAGCNRPATVFHHTSYNPPRGYCTCTMHNPTGGAVKGA